MAEPGAEEEATQQAAKRKPSPPFVPLTHPDFFISFPVLPDPLSIPEVPPTTPRLSFLTSPRKPPLDSPHKNLGQAPIFFSQETWASISTSRDAQGWGKELEGGEFQAVALTIHPSHILAWALGSCPIPIKPSVSPFPTTLRICPHSAHPSPSRISWDSSHWVLGNRVWRPVGVGG